MFLTSPSNYRNQKMRQSVHEQLLEAERSDRLARDRASILSQIRQALYRLPDGHPAALKLEEALACLAEA